MLINIARTERLQRSNFADLYINIPRQANHNTTRPRTEFSSAGAFDTNEEMLSTRVTDPK